VLRGVLRVRASVHFDGAMVKLESRIQCRTERAAAKLLRFVDTFREGLATSPKHGATLADLEISQTGTVLHVEWKLPRHVVWGLLRAKPAAAAQVAPATGDDAPTPAVEGAES
jgi:hypothetical protein